MKQPRSILITGASSGIGAALARAYAAPGITLHLGGRDEARLEAVVADCRAAGAEAASQIADTTDKAAMTGWIEAADESAPLDLVIANAGVSAGTGDHGEAPDQARRIFAINVDGVVNTALPTVARMAPRRRGQIALMSSLAGFRGLPGAPAYCASKAAVRVWGESLRGTLAPSGLQVSVICPGFVKSPMTDVNPFPMPFLMAADKAAERIKRGLARGRGRIAFPWPLAIAVWALSALPPGLTDFALRQLPEKP
ncbi:MAG: SDR family NAD(P)-dependent oxidoreductase [Pseudomonadota bacterium]